MIRELAELLPLAPFLAGYAAGMVGGAVGGVLVTLLAMAYDR